LLLWLWLTLALVGVGCAAVTYIVSRRETNSQLDYQMEQIATFVGAQSISAASSTAIIPQPSPDHDLEGAYLVGVRDAAGHVLYASRPEIRALPLDWLGFRTVTLGDDDYRVFSALSGSHRIAVAQQVELRQESAADAALMALVPVLVLIPILGLVISLVIRRQLQPMNATAGMIAGRPPLAMDPLPVAGLPAEVLPLIVEINRLLDRLRTASEREQRFIADAAHALRTPLAALQLQADVVEGSPDAATRSARVAQLRAGIRRAVRLSNHLLLLARNETAVRSMRDPIELDVALTEAYELYAPVAAARGVILQLEVGSGAVVAANARQIAQLAGNLLDNALRHTPVGGRVAASVLCDAHHACLQVVDEGPGLPEAELEKVGERFYRVPGDATEGSGLGLAVVHEIAEQLGGRVRLQNREDRSGLIARVWLPRLILEQSDADREPS